MHCKRLLLGMLLSHLALFKEGALACGPCSFGPAAESTYESSGGADAGPHLFSTLTPLDAALSLRAQKNAVQFLPRVRAQCFIFLH